MLPRRYPTLILVALLLSACADNLVEPEPEFEIPITDLLDGAIVLSRNPSGIAPLTAEGTLETKVPTRLTIRVMGEEEAEYESAGYALEHEFWILGLYPGRVNQVEVTLTDDEGMFGRDTLELKTDPLPSYFPSVEVVQADRQAMEPGWTLSSLSFGNGGKFSATPIMFDHRGDIRWYLDLSHLGETSGGVAFPMRRFANGNLMAAAEYDVLEYDMLGRLVNSWKTPGYWYHHEVIEKPDGNLIVAVDVSGRETVEDHIIEIDRTSGAVVREWDLRQILDVDRMDFIPNPTDWFHMNAIWYDAQDDALIVSGRSQGVVKITGSNELVWILSPHKGWGNAGVDGTGPDTTPFLLTAVDASGTPYPENVQLGLEDASDFSWAWGQHATMLLPSGNLFLFDNGVNRTFDPAANRSRGVEYAIDEQAMTVRQIWQYGEERGPEFYSSIISDVDLLTETGNRLIMPGHVMHNDHYALVTEVDPTGRRVFEAKIAFKDQRGTGEFAWGQFDIVYRSERLTLYP